MERFFQVLAVILIGVAAFFVWMGDSDWLFASVVLSACAFFLSVRFRIKARMKQRELETGHSGVALAEARQDSQIRESKDPEPSK